MCAMKWELIHHSQHKTNKVFFLSSDICNDFFLFTFYRLDTEIHRYHCKIIEWEANVKCLNLHRNWQLKIYRAANDTMGKWAFFSVQTINNSPFRYFATLWNSIFELFWQQTPRSIRVWTIGKFFACKKKGNNNNGNEILMPQSMLSAS